MKWVPQISNMFFIFLIFSAILKKMYLGPQISNIFFDFWYCNTKKCIGGPKFPIFFFIYYYSFIFLIFFCVFSFFFICSYFWWGCHPLWMGYLWMGSIPLQMNKCVCILKISRSYQTRSLSPKLEAEQNGLKMVEMVHFTGKHMKLRAPLIELGLSWQTHVPNCYYRRMQTYGYMLICVFSYHNQRKHFQGKGEQSHANNSQD